MTMKRWTAVALLVVMVVALTGCAGGERSFTLHNNSNVAITRMYLSASKNITWEDDILSSNINVRGSRGVTISSDFRNVNVWDMRFDFANGTYVEFFNINLSNCKNMYLVVDAYGRYSVNCF